MSVRLPCISQTTAAALATARGEPRRSSAPTRTPSRQNHSDKWGVDAIVLVHERKEQLPAGVAAAGGGGNVALWSLAADPALEFVVGRAPLWPAWAADIADVATRQVRARRAPVPSRLPSAPGATSGTSGSR